MPLQSAVVFASHIGHTGKTTLCFQMSCYYAKRHPETSVLVMDLAEEGDLTKRLLGGVDASKEKAEEVFGRVFTLLSDAERRPTGLTRWLWSSDSEPDICQHAVRVCDHNGAVPGNLFLISSGAWPRQDTPMDVETRQRVCQKIRSALQTSESTWRLFCDTDGDRRPSPFTLIGYSLCPHAIVPVHLNKGDLDRTETMLGVLNEHRARGEINTQVLFLVWNFVNSIKGEPCEHHGVTLPFTPTKVMLDILDACNRRLFQTCQDLPGLFAHESNDQASFLHNSTVCLKVLADNVLRPSEELGLPFVEIADRLAASGKKSMKFQSGSVEYKTEESVVSGVEATMLELETKFEAMSISSSPPMPPPAESM